MTNHCLPVQVQELPVNEHRSDAPLEVLAMHLEPGVGRQDRQASYLQRSSEVQEAVAGLCEGGAAGVQGVGGGVGAEGAQGGAMTNH